MIKLNVKKVISVTLFWLACIGQCCLIFLCAPLPTFLLLMFLIGFWQTLLIWILLGIAGPAFWLIKYRRQIDKDDIEQMLSMSGIAENLLIIMSGPFSFILGMPL